MLVVVGVWQGQEVVKAVASGYIVFAFEPNLVYVQRVSAKIDKLKAGRWWYKAKLSPTGELLKPLPLPPQEGGLHTNILFDINCFSERCWQALCTLFTLGQRID